MLVVHLWWVQEHCCDCIRFLFMFPTKAVLFELVGFKVCLTLNKYTQLFEVMP